MKQITLTKPQPRYISGWNIQQFKTYDELYNWSREIDPGDCSVNMNSFIYSYMKDWRG